MKTGFSGTNGDFTGRAAVLICLVAAASVLMFAQASPPDPLAAAFKEVPAPPVPPGEIKLAVKGGAKPYPEPESWVGMGRMSVVRNVWQPTLTPVLPPAGRRTGAAVIIAPGGAFMILSMHSEGFDLANFLASRGIAAFVLKYRLLPTPKISEFGKFFMDRFNDREGFSSWFAAQMKIAGEDAQQAMQVVRARAGEWDVDPQRVGILGFSAGAYTAMALVAAGDPATNPNFMGYVYGPLNEAQLPATLPPLFIALAADDPLFGQSDFGLVRQWQARKAPVELHLFERGGHGFGYPGMPGTTTTEWGGLFVKWLEARGLLAKSR